MMIEVFGPGCIRCEQTFKLFQNTAIELGRDDIGITKITNTSMFAARGVMMTPAVIIDGVLKCQGRVPSAAEAKSWITELSK